MLGIMRVEKLHGPICRNVDQSVKLGDTVLRVFKTLKITMEFPHHTTV